MSRNQEIHRQCPFMVTDSSFRRMLQLQQRKVRPMKKADLFEFYFGLLFALLFVALGILFICFSLPHNTGNNHCRIVTAKLVSSTPYYVEEIDSEAAWMRTKYHCEWQYQIAGKSYTLWRDQARKPATTTSLCITHLVCPTSNSDLNFVSLLMGIAALCFGGYGIHSLISETIHPDRKESSASADE